MLCALAPQPTVSPLKKGEGQAEVKGHEGRTGRQSGESLAFCSPSLSSQDEPIAQLTGLCGALSRSGSARSKLREPWTIAFPQALHPLPIHLHGETASQRLLPDWPAVNAPPCNTGAERPVSHLRSLQLGRVGPKKKIFFCFKSVLALQLSYSKFALS